MDDKNQTNQPLDQASTPVVPSVPEDITPAESPVTTTTTTTSSIEPIAPVEMPSVPPTVTTPPAAPLSPPQETTPSVSWPIPEPTPQAETTTTTTTTVATPTLEPASAPTPDEVPMPTGKPMKKISPIIGGLVALLLVVGVAGAAYYVSNQLSTRQALAPNAPESKPSAYETCSDTSDCSVGICVNGRCSTTATITATTCPASECSVAGQTSCNNVTKVNYTCVLWGGSCPGGYYKVSGTCGDTGGGGGGGGGTGGTSDCVRDGTPGCHVAAPSPDVCTQSGFTFACGNECCSNSGSVCCCNGCFPASQGCSAHGGTTCAAAATCDATKRDAPASNEITFAKTGKIIPFMRNTYTGTLTLSKTGSADINIPLKTGEAAELTSFNVNAGDKYMVKVKISTESKNSYGWIPNKGAEICGPVKTPGDPLDNNNKATGKCGEEVGISPVKTAALSKTDLDGITAGTTNASIQCWADAELGDATQDYDYNDFTVVFGYEKAAQTVGACVEMKIYKKVGAVYGTVPLTPAELGSLKVGDVLKLVSMANTDKLKGRFQITIGSEAPELRQSEFVDTTPKQHVLTDYTISKAGTYKFEAQVTTKSTN